MVSDLHYGIRPFKGRDESKVFEALYDAVQDEKPNLVLSAGDFGEKANEEMFGPICKQACFLTIYGNHDNIGLIKSLWNENGTLCWLSDGNIIEWESLRIAAINGNIVLRKRKPHHRTPEEVEQLIEAYAAIGRMDMPVTHEAPKHHLLKSIGYEVLSKAMEVLKPKSYLCGHIHFPSQIIEVGGT